MVKMFLSQLLPLSINSRSFFPKGSIKHDIYVFDLIAFVFIKMCRHSGIGCRTHGQLNWSRLGYEKSLFPFSKKNMDPNRSRGAVIFTPLNIRWLIKI